jgi:hypothetical protein
MSSAEQLDGSQEENDGKTDNHKDRTLRRAGRRMLRRYCFRFRLFRFFAGKVERKISVIANNRRRGLRRLCGKALRFCSGRLFPGTSLFHIADARPGNGGGCPNAPVRHFCNPQPFDADARAET